MHGAILIVENSKFIRNMMSKFLQEQGYESVIEAGDGKEALDVLMEHKVDLIISGLNMPKVNGLELLKALVNHSSLKHIPFMVLTSDLSSRNFKIAMETGAADFIKKPFTSMEIAAKIKSVLKKS